MSKNYNVASSKQLVLNSKLSHPTYLTKHIYNIHTKINILLLSYKSGQKLYHKLVPWPSWLRRGANKFNLLRQDQQFDPARDQFCFC